LRPVLLTTLTTVLGLAPLLFEKSSQAQFLKPTVITLVYGLGFGLVLVLLLVPALLAMQQDFGRQLRALRRSARLIGRRGVGIALAMGGVTLAMAGLFAVTLGSVMWNGALPQALSMGSGSMAEAFGLFVAGSGALAVLAYVLGIVAFGLRRRVR